MIRCTIVEATVKDGEVVSKVSRAIVADSLTLGRAAACKIYLPAPQVRLEHARIRRAENGYLMLEGVGGTVQVDGQALDTVRLALSQAIVIGPFEFEVSHLNHGPECDQPLLKLQFVHKPINQNKSEPASAKGSLHRSFLGLRSVSWLVALLLGLALLALPLWQAYQPMQSVLNETGAIKADAIWNPGPISSAHTNIGNQCQNCHAKPFERVADKSCVACHKSTGPHIPAHKDLQNAVFAGERCATCHKEHQGEDSMKKVDAVGCETCHANVKAVAPTSNLPNVGDFAKDHPDFRLTMKVNNTADGLQRFTHSPSLKENSGLKFPHDIHLSKRGVRSPNAPKGSGTRVILQCDSCHELDSAKVRFKPVRMEQACISCHQLGIDAQNATRQVPHDKPAVVVQALRDRFSALALEKNPSQVVTVNTLLQGPQVTAAPSVSSTTTRWVQDKTAAAAIDMFENPKGTCLTCHAIERFSSEGVDGLPRWEVQPVLSNAHWLPKSKFSHLQHANADCSSCHAASLSKASSDILIPAIATCRDCHIGTQRQALNVAMPDKVVSQCSSCHDFHSPVVHVSFKGAKSHPAMPGKQASAP